MSSMTHIIGILDFIVSQISSLVNGGGEYHYDLTGDGQVIRADAAAPWRDDPQVAVSFRRADPITGESNLCSVMRQVTIWVVGFAPSDEINPDGEATVALQALSNAGLRMLDDVSTAIETDRTLGGRVVSMNVSHEMQTGAALDGGLHFATALLTVVVKYQIKRGL